MLKSVSRAMFSRKRQATDRVRVFISYSHDSSEHEQRVMALANRLRADGIEAWIDQYAHDPDEGWTAWMRHQVALADCVLLVFTKTYERRFEDDEDEDKGLDTAFKGTIVTRSLYESEGPSFNFRPVVFTEEDEQFIPPKLRRFNNYRVDTSENYVELLWWLIPMEWRAPPLPEPELVSPVLPPADPVSFSVFAPGVIRPAQQFILDLWAHLPTQTDEVTSLACEFARDRRLGVKAQVAVACGTVLSVVLDLPLLRIKDPIDTIVWASVPVYASFIVDVPTDVVAGNHAGRVIISASGIPVAKVAFYLPIEPTGVRGVEAPQRFPTIRYQPRSAFASFSSRDREEVLGRVQGMTKVCRDLDVFVDVISLRSGQDWEMQIRQQIPARDVFFLFWSLNAARSKEVEKEWRIALEMRGLGYIDPIPLTDPRISPPPKELASLHFNDLYVAFLEQLRKRQWWEFYFEKSTDWGRNGLKKFSYWDPKHIFR